MENAEIIKRKSSPRAGVKQTSTPLSNNKGVVYFKTLSNVSSIRNKDTEIKHPIIESPSIIDWGNSSDSPRNTHSYQNSSGSFEDVGKRRPDTPLKSNRSRFSNASLCPVKLRFSEVSNSSNVNSKRCDIKRHHISTAHKHLYTDERSRSDNAKMEYLKMNKRYELQHMPDEQQTKKVCNVSLDEQLYAKFNEKCSEKLKKSPTTHIVSKRNRVALDHNTEKEADIHFELSNSSTTTLDENACIRSFDDFIKGKATKKNDVKKRIAKFDEKSCRKLEKSPKSHIRFERNQVTIGRDMEKEAEIHSGILNSPIPVSPKKSCNEDLIETKSTKNDDQRKKNEKFDIEISKIWENSTKTRIRCDKNQVSIGREIEKEVDIHFGLLHSSSTTLTENACSESFDIIKTKSTRKGDERKTKTSKNRTKRQRKAINISSNFVNIIDSLDETQFNKSKCSSTHMPRTTYDSLRTENKKRNVEIRKELRTKSKINLGERQEQEKVIGRAELKGSIESFVLDSDNIQCNSGKEVVDKVEIFKKPFTAKKRTISKGTTKGRKGGKNTLFPPTSTPLDTPPSGNKELPLLFESISPIKSSRKTNKSFFLDDFHITKIKAKRTYAKTETNNSKLDKEISDWESFLKKSSYRRNNNNYVRDSETSSLKSSDSVILFESPPMIVDEGADIFFPESGFKRSKASERRSRQNEKGRMKRAYGESTKTKRGETKQWFETTKLRGLADHFNEISEVSLIIENKRKNEKKGEMKSYFAL